MNYCRACILPDSRPGIELDDQGICSGCRGHNQKTHAIDWTKRDRELNELIAAAKQRAHGDYDCIVPVSGGKDSFWQVAQCLERGLRVLAVTWKSPGRNELGQANLDKLAATGVDHIDYTIDPSVESRFMLASLERTGSSAVPMHFAIFSIPLRLAVGLRIPLVIWGESPFMEYGGDAGDSDLNKLDHAWLRRHGILQDTTIEDWIGEDLSAQDLAPYRLPDAAAFAAGDIQSIFLGYYLPWDPATSLAAAKSLGFQVRASGPKVGYYDYADIDCDFISVHHWFKWHKFGFARLFANLSLEIRNGRLTRAAAVDIVRRMGPQRPTDDINRATRFMGITDRRFAEIEAQWRNRKIWRLTDNVWQIPGFLVPDWDCDWGRDSDRPATEVA